MVTLRMARHFRLSVVLVIAISLFVTLFVRLFYLQVIESDEMRLAASQNASRVMYESAPRGRILDSDGHVLVGNREVDVVVADRQALQRDPSLIPRLSEFLGIPQADLQKRSADPRRSIYAPALLADHLDKPSLVSLREHQADFPGVSVATEIERSYPYGSLAAHVLGYVGEANESELQRRKDQGYRQGDLIGKVGIEAAYEDDLRGKPGKQVVEVDAKGRIVRVLEHREPIPGNDVKLAISAKLQQSAELALAEGLALARTQDDLTTGVATGEKHTAPAGSLVALDPTNGEVRALASYPSFDPGRFARGITTEEYAQLSDPHGSLPLTNRAIAGQYAPGSTFKLFTALAAVDTKTMGPRTPFRDNGTFTLGDRSYRNAQGRSYGTIDLARAMAVSSDVYFYSVGNELWNTRRQHGTAIQDSARAYGLGAVTGIDVSGELSGRIPDPASRKKMHEENPRAFPESNWYAGDNVNLAIGQGDVLATPLQLALAYGTFAMGGVEHRPHLVREVLKSDGTLVRSVVSEGTREVEMSTEARTAIEEGLVGAVNRPSGTAYAAFANYGESVFSVAGKTGTAQVTGKQDSALFVGYGPVSSPRFSVSVVLEQAGFGGTSAAPVARRVFEAASNQPISEARLGTGAD